MSERSALRQRTGPTGAQAAPAGHGGRSAPLDPEIRRLWGLAAQLLRRGGDDARAATLWARICLGSAGDPAAHEALAKLLEHRLADLLGRWGWTRARTLGLALAVTRASSAPCPRRLARLRHKLAKHSRAEPDSVYG